MTSLCAHRKREERLRKVLQALERVEQMKEEKKKQIEQKFAQIDEKTEKVRAWAVGGSSVDWTHGDLTGLLPHIFLSIMGPAFCSTWRVEGLLWSEHSPALLAGLPPGCPLSGAVRASQIHGDLEYPSRRVLSPPLKG